ncbi:MAG: hypothetical protein WD226_04230 [Planctomycetota bacterium]
MMKQLHLLAVGLSCLGIGLTLGSCGGGGSSAAENQGGFQLIQTNVQNNEIWAINRPLKFTFNQDVEFASVNLNTVNIQTATGQPAVGTFSFESLGGGSVNRSIIVFQPACPTLADLSDSGLRPGGIPYVITVRGLSGGTSNTVRSLTGQSLTTTQTRNFTTPVALDPTQAFVDGAAGPPLPLEARWPAAETVTRVPAASFEPRSYLEIGAGERFYLTFFPDVGARRIVRFDASTLEYVQEPDFEVPLNLYSDPSSRVAVVLQFNQPLNPAASNISPNLLTVQTLTSGVWTRVETEVELVANCTTSGATVRLEPRGILPPGDGTGVPNFRVAVLAGFQDVVGQQNLVNIENLATTPTKAINFQSLTPAGDEADEIFEDFLISGGNFGSIEDRDVLFDAPRAEWTGGTLTSAFNFPGDGGPNGDFDWILGSSAPGAQAQTFFFNTVSQQVLGGPGGVATETQNASNGVLNVRNLIIEENVTLSAFGVNPLVINATGDVIIRGRLTINGTSAQDVATLNTGNIPEQGGAGQGGGGRGGSASEVVTTSTPRGGTGFGPFNAPGGGGEGGESQYAPGNVSKQFRRPGGGGGGAHSLPPITPQQDVATWWPTAANDTVTDTEDPYKGLIARQGRPGHANGTGAISNTDRAQGGFPGPLVFNDIRDDNNFFGVRAETIGGELVLTRGEAFALLPGTGGGGGGDAVKANQFPAPNWNIGTDEKGAGGGGGAGGLRIRALGRIIITGKISANGGRGGVGENVIFLDHIGGDGAGGSGGHIMLESGSKVYLGRNPGSAVGTERVVVEALGGLANFGQWDTTAAAGLSTGGQGGPGLIQIHVPRPQIAPSGSGDETVSDILIPFATDFDEFTSPEAIVLVPNYARRSIGQSKWLSLGEADVDPVMGPSTLNFLFGGTDPGANPAMLDPGEGQVLTEPAIGDPDSKLVQEVAPVLTGQVDGADVSVAPDESTLIISGAGLDPILVTAPEVDVYLRTPELLERFILRLVRNGGTAGETVHDFEVLGAAYDDLVASLAVLAGGSASTLQDIIDLPGTNDVSFALVPRFFRLSGGGVQDRLSDSATVTIHFQGTSSNALGQPNEDAVLVDWTGDVSEFSNVAPGQLDFVRFRVEFDLDSNDMGLSPETQQVSLDFLRLPFRF